MDEVHITEKKVKKNHDEKKFDDDDDGLEYLVRWKI